MDILNEKYLIILLCILSIISPLLGIFNNRWKNQKNFFRPANFIFLIWIPIYIGIIIFTLYCDYEKIIYDYLLGSIFLNFVWLLAASNELTKFLTVPIIIGMYYYTYKTYDLIYENNYLDKNINKDLIIGTSLYFGWLNIALFANIIAELERYFPNLNNNLINYISIIFLVFVIELCLYYNYIYSYDFYFTIVFIWAIFGIIYKQIN